MNHTNPNVIKRTSIRTRLIRFFLITSLVPIAVLGVFSSYNISHTLRDNSEALIQNNLRQMDINLNISLDAYEDVLYQAYTDDNIVSWVQNIDQGEEQALNINQMKRTIKALADAKEYIRAITVITPQLNVITCDKMGAVSYQSSWIGNFGKDEETLYEEVSASTGTQYYPTQYTTTFANTEYYTFQMAHRIIDYRNIYRDCGIVVISVDQALLEEICSRMNDSTADLSYVVDENNNRICYMDKDLPGTTENKELYTYQDASLGWSIYYLRDVSELTRAIRAQTALILLIVFAIFIVAIMITIHLSRELTSSADIVLEGMRHVESGEIQTQVDAERIRIAEIERIASGFNRMAVELKSSQDKEKAALDSQREAQIAALEAQINPHFIYNTLDSINWMAIDKDEYDISNAINALANILRYAISDSTKEVTIANEVDWLKKYLFLQQFRLKNSFTCGIDVAAEVQQCKIHKLLIQPFVENSILHAFEKSTRTPHLDITIRQVGDMIRILVFDNGTGMPEELVEEINRGELYMEGDRGHIGMANAMTRMRMYYGDAARLSVRSSLDTGTEITVLLPLL